MLSMINPRFNEELALGLVIDCDRRAHEARSTDGPRLALGSLDDLTNGVAGGTSIS